MLKLADNPPITYPIEQSVRELTGQWWVAHTKARAEKAFARDLQDREIGYFLPMVEKVTFSGGRKRYGMSPLFTGYVFFCGEEPARYQALLTDRLCQVIKVRDQARFIDELGQIECALKGGATLDPFPYAAVGRRCRVRQGAMQGIEGVVAERDSVSRLVLAVSILGQSVAVEMDTSLLEAVD